ncbi:DUF1799 domain-containing protein [Devosia sp. J2-20]|uniref:DUF1799 domain-containing protein n=1 Tax=Devosia sp. J2-20 TaxID=3026161 RepID=UPI00249A014F|nr:DUF1799 domain-containing protein [Devosia sp. J2-20]WDR00753.1 DUF1799 domain-containing protein [Devosia sp. J2-20]
MFEVWDINAASLDLFLAAQSQWRVISVGMSGVLIWLGLDYQGVDVIMRRRGARDNDDALFGDLLVMEGAALDVFGEIER